MIESVRVLSTLKSMDDFVELAKKDMELALRLMEYRDFTEAPLFKDLRIRTIYEGLRGHGNRQNALEEFFLATGVKEPIELTLSTAKKVYDKPKDIVNDKVVLRKNTWGYLYMEVRADGDFIEIPKKVITQADFEEDRLDLPDQNQERMHRRKEPWRDQTSHPSHGDTVIRIEAMGRNRRKSAPRREISKAGVCRYMKLREAYASGLYEKTCSRKDPERAGCHPQRKRRLCDPCPSPCRRRLIWTRRDRIRRLYVWTMRGIPFLPSETGSEHSTVITSTCSTAWNRTRRRRTLWSACSGKNWRMSTEGFICSFCS